MIPVYDIEWVPRDAVPAVCAVYSHIYDPTVRGCTIQLTDKKRIVLPEGSRYTCVYWHELRHVYEGAWHGNRVASPQEGCDWRPPTEKEQ